MAYISIHNLYKDIKILEFKQCYAMEKVHGTSAFIRFDFGTTSFFSGGMSRDLFSKIFDWEQLDEKFKVLGQNNVVVFGEAYGGKEQGMSATYGPNPSFIAFEVKIEDCWLGVEEAHKVVDSLGLEFVPYEKGPAELEWLNTQRDADSIVAIRRGMGPGKKREGIVIRPPIEVFSKNGERYIAKHKRDDFRETASPREVDPKLLKVLSEAEDIANEWVTPMRMEHILQKIPQPHNMSQIPLVISSMIEDVIREGSGEIIDSKEARKAIGKLSVRLFKKAISEF